MICYECEEEIGSSTCTPLSCCNDIQLSLMQCRCEVCHCHQISSKKLCSSCVQGQHRGEI